MLPVQITHSNALETFFFFFFCWGVGIKFCSLYSSEETLSRSNLRVRQKGSLQKDLHSI